MDASIFNIQKFCLHDGPGIRTTVFFAGCNLRCKWCANPESWFRGGETADAKIRRVSLDELLRECLKDRAFYERSGGGVSFSGGEPLLQADFLRAFAEALVQEGVGAGIETAGCVPPEVFQSVLPALGFVLMDLKHWDAEKLRAGTGAVLNTVLVNLKTALKEKEAVTVRIPVIPGYNDSVQDAKKFASLLCGIGANKVDILPFHQLGEKKYADLKLPYAYDGVRQTREESLAAYRETLCAQGLRAQIGG